MAEPEPDTRDIAPLRQPMVTSIGIILGFVLSFLANWATEEDGGPALQDASDYAVASTLLVSVALMCLVLFRLLDMRHPPELLARRYDRTFLIYKTAIILAFAGVGLALLV